MDPTIEVDAIAQEDADGAQSVCNLYLRVDGGYPVTDLCSGKVGYVVWIGVDKARELVEKLTKEIVKAQ